MPAYDYTCSSGHVYTETRLMSEEQKVTECPVEGCGLVLNRIWEAVPAVFNGKGFYTTDKNPSLLKPGQQVDW